MNWKSALCQLVFCIIFGITAQLCGYRAMVITALALIMGYIYAKDIGWLNIGQHEKPTTDKDKDDEDFDPNYMTRFYVVNFGDGKFGVSRSKMQRRDSRLLTRRELFADNMELAQFFYCQAHMCCSWDPPYGGVKGKGKRPTKEWWLSQPPCEYEVDQILSNHIFKDKAYISG